MKDSLLEQVRAKVIEAVPGRKWRYTCDHCPCGTIIEEKAGLVDVLRAIEAMVGATSSKCVLENRTFYFYYEPVGWMDWNLAANLEEQSEEVVSFLYDILCGK